MDVSADGKDIVFDLLGIFTMPVAGGTAALLSTGCCLGCSAAALAPMGSIYPIPAIKPEPTTFWIMNRDGSNKKDKLPKETFRLLNNATWMPNSDYLIARKHFTGIRSLGAGEMWMYSIYGGEGSTVNQKRKNDQQDAGEPNVSPNGRSPIL